MDLLGTRVLVLGGTSGIGLATAEAAANLGAELVVASSSRVRVDKALATLPSGTTGHVADFSDPAAVAALVDSVGTIDHLVYTAGEPLALTPLAELDVETARNFFAVRYFGVLAAVRAAAPHLRAGGSITLTTGVAKDRPGPGWAAAASLCGAMEALTRALAVELAPIRVNAISPGVVRSPLWSGMTDEDREGLYTAQAESLPVGRVGEVSDVAQAFLFCMTQGYATGTVLTVDGGSVLI